MHKDMTTFCTKCKVKKTEFLVVYAYKYKKKYIYK